MSGGKLEALIASVDLSFVDALPPPLAVTALRLQSTAANGQCLATLHCVCNVVECGLRLLAAAGIAERFDRVSADAARLHGVAEELLLPLLTRAPSLGTWVDVVQHVADTASEGAESVGEKLVAIVRDPDACWKPLFQDEGHVVTYRNEMLGHGVFTSESTYLPGLVRFVPMLAKWLKSSHRWLWSVFHLESPPLQWNRPGRASSTRARRSSWMPVLLRGPNGSRLSLDPLVRATTLPATQESCIALFSAIRCRRRRRTALGLFLDYFQARGLKETPFENVLEPFLAYDSYARDSSPREVRCLESATTTADERRFKRRVESIGYLEKAVASWANNALSDRVRGGYARLVGPAGCGKSWFVREIPRWSAEADSVAWKRESVLHGGRCYKFCYRVSQHNKSLRGIWGELTHQARDLDLDTSAVEQLSVDCSISDWFGLLRANNREIENGGSLFLVIDGLDEIPGREACSGFLKKVLSPLPSGCAILLTSRQQVAPAIDDCLTAVEAREGKHFSNFSIDTESSENQAVVAWFVRSKRLSDQREQEVLRLSHGVFLYAHHYARVCMLLDPGERLPEQEEIYRFLLGHLRKRIGQSPFQGIHVQLLATLQAAREPLSLESLVVHWSLSADWLPGALSDLDFMVQSQRDDEGEVQYALSHALVATQLQNDPEITAAAEQADREYARRAFEEVYDTNGAGSWDAQEVIDDPALAYAALYLAHHLRHSGDHEKARKVERDTKRHEVLLSVGRTLRKQARDSRALQFLEECDRCLQVMRRHKTSRDDRLEVQYLEVLQERAEASPHSVAKRLIKKVLEVATKLESQQHVAWAFWKLGRAEYLGSSYAAAVSYYQRARKALAGTQADAALDARCELGLAEITYQTNRYEEALHSCNALLEHRAPALGDRFRAEVERLRGRVLFDLKQHERAVSCLDAAISVFEKEGDLGEAIDCIGFKSDPLLELDRLEEAVVCARRAFNSYVRMADFIGASEAARTLGEIAMRRNDSGEAESWLNRSLEYAHASRDPATRLEAMVTWCKLLVAARRFQEARSHLPRARALAARLRDDVLMQELVEHGAKIPPG